MDMWKPISGIKGYEVSDDGQVRSIPRIVVDKNGKEYFRKGKILSQFYNKKGYANVQIKGRVRPVHRLVAETFIPNPENKPEVNHIDGNKKNNKVTNLEWVTTRENLDHAYKLGLRNYNNVLNYNKRRSIKVEQRDLEGNLIKVHESFNAAYRSVNGSSSGLYSACNKGKTYRGFKWSYAEPCND